MKNKALGCLCLVINSIFLTFASLVFILTLSPTLLGIPEDAQSASASEQSFTPGSAIPPELVKVADLPGGDIMDIEFVRSSPNIVYLASDPNAMGIWRSDDAGETWRQILADYGTGGPAHIHDIAVHPDNPDVVLVSDAHSLIKMVVVEDGVEWTIVYPPTPPELPQPEQPLTVFAVAISPSVPSVSYAVDEHGNILKSTDSGDTWQTVGQLEVQWGVSLAVDPGSPDTLYVGTRGEGGGVFKSTNGGQNWQQVLDMSDLFISIAPGVSDLVFAAGWRGIFKSTDGGATWRLTLDRPANSVQVAPSDPRIVYAATPEGVLKSDDGGETWANRNTGIEDLDVGPLAVHPNDPNTVIAGKFIFSPGTSGEGIYKTTDGGLSWVRKGDEFIDVDVVEVAVDPSNPNVVYAGTRCSRGAYRTEDGGASWTFLPRGPRWAAHYTMRIAAATGSTVWLTGADGMEWSNDRGQTWNSPLDEQKRHFHAIAISPHDPRLMFVGTVSVGWDPVQATYYPGARILRSTDGGETWQEVGTGFPSGADSAIEDFAFDPFNSAVIYVSTSTHHRLTDRLSDTLGIYKSTDSGETWSPLNTGLTDKNVHSIVISPATPGLLYAGTTTGVFRSTDGGDSWAYIGPSEHVHRLLIDPAEPSYLYAGTDSGLFWSSDGGDTWQRLESVPAKPVMGLAMDANGKALYAAVNSVGVFRAYTGADTEVAFTLTVIRSGTGSGTVTSNPSGITCGTDCTESYDSGTSVTLTASPDAGSVFAGWSGGGCTGTGTCSVTMNADTAVTVTFNQAATQTQLSNISTRGLVQTGDSVQIGGFIIGGSDPKTVLIRARGPTLTDFGVPGELADPFLQLFSGQTVIAQNDNWQTTDPLCGSPAVSCGGQAEIVATGLDPCVGNMTGCAQESAIYITLSPGSYTAIVSGVNVGAGVGLIEVFGAGATSTSRLTNISTRGVVGTGDDVMIGGLIIAGTDPKTVLVRARGPVLTDFGVPGELSDPFLQLFSGQTVIALNDNWQVTDPLCGSPAVSCGGTAEITATGLDPCVGNLTGCAREAAILITLPPGPYTAIVSGVGGGTGVGLVEVFEVNGAP